MDMRKEMVATYLREAVWADQETRQRLIQELARDPEETLDALIAIIEHYDKPFLALAAQAIRAIGYPKNAIAIPCLVDLISDQNVPGRLDAILALQEMEVGAVVPYFLQYMLKRDDDYAGWSYGVDGIVSALGAREEWALMCGPAVSYLLAQHDYKPKNTPDTDYLLTLLEQILPACSYAIPALYYVALHQQGTDVGRFAHRLLFSFDSEALKPYERLLAFLPSDV